jgi:4-hydroxyphenylpyruvate dioxygenase-like putative hemolysin
MRTFGILYDRDEAGGELFHLYTGMLGHRLFLEVVQRVGGYEGYGEVNAPVRAAAQLATVDDAARRQGRTVGRPQVERNPLSDG